VNHQEAWELIPWLANDTLDDTPREQLEQHVAGCALCRGELATQRSLIEAMHAAPQVEAMPRASLQKLWDHVDADTPPGSEASSAPPAPLRRTRHQAALIAAAAGVILLLGTALLATLHAARNQEAAPFRTVSETATPAPAGAIRAVFAGEMTMAQLQALLDGTGLHIVAGPTASGVYTLGVSPEQDGHAALASLRTHPAVRFAEPAAP
jgi:hypothetical protein